MGDIHGFWSSQDTDYFNNSDYQFLLLTGDLPSFNRSRNLKLQKELRKLTIPTYMSLGNWDSSNIFQLAAEVIPSKFLSHIGSLGHINRIDSYRFSLPNIIMGHYDSFKLVDGSYTLLIGRPFTCGGPLAFVPTLKRKFHITSLEDSFLKYKEIINQSESNTLIILNHNGPTGLGDRATDIYGCDFKKEEGDWGDSDLEEAIRYAKSIGKTIPFVVSGHMHHHNPKTKSTRKTMVSKEGTTYLNAAKVPRFNSYYSVLLDGTDINVELLTTK